VQRRGELSGGNHDGVRRARLQRGRHDVPHHVHFRRALRDRSAPILPVGRLCTRSLQRSGLSVGRRMHERRLRRRRLLQQQLHGVLPGLRCRRARRNLLAGVQRDTARPTARLRRNRLLRWLLQQSRVRPVLLPRLRDQLPMRSSERHVRPDRLLPGARRHLPVIAAN
jgi:hypothetical protein